MMNGAIYIRVSTVDQTEFSPDAQLKAIKDFARKNNIIIDPKYIYKDEGISGRKAEKRPGFMDMIKTAKSKPKPFDVILVHKFDRFARNREDSIVYKSLLKKEYDIQVISISEHIDNSGLGIVMEAILEAMAEYYSINLSAEVKKGQLEKHSRGELQTSPSYGYKVENNKLIINNDEADIVKFIFEKYALENRTMMEICRLLLKLGIKTKRGKSFENRTIYYILNNPVYIGKLRYTPGRRNSYDFDDPNTVLVEGKHQSIITNELWDSVQMKLASNNKWKKPKQRIDNSVKNWTKGLIRCKSCGCTMVTNGKLKLRCNGYNKGKCNNSNTINISEVKEIIINQIYLDITNGTINNIVEKQIKTSITDNYSILINKLNLIKNKEERIKESYREGIDTLDEYKENKQILTREKENIEIELSKCEKPKVNNHKKEIIENGKKVYQILSDEKISEKEKNEIVHILINKVEFDGDSNHLSLYYN